MKKIALVDTSFSRINMGEIALNACKKYSQNHDWQFEIIRRTVPGFKDLAVECLCLLQDSGCDIAIAMGWVGGMDIDRQCGHEASLAIAQAQLMAKKHILEVFIHEKEANSANELYNIAINRTTEHCYNAMLMLFEPQMMITRAGGGIRQGGKSVGPLKDSD